MSTPRWQTLSQGRAVPAAAVPVLPVETLREDTVQAVTGGQRVCAFFGTRLDPDRVRLLAILADDAPGGPASAAAADVRSEFPSFTPDCPQVHLFEREIAEQTGVTPVGHPWLKPVRFSRTDYPGRSGQADAAPTIGLRDFLHMEGDEVHEVAVGPVHAGVIEPGHFRFQCHGETVYHLEISLGYQHRGIEKRLVGGPARRSFSQMQVAAGDTTIGQALTYCQACEALAETRSGPPRPSAASPRTRTLANHTATRRLAGESASCRLRTTAGPSAAIFST